MNARPLLIAAVLLVAAPLLADEGVEDATGSVFVIKPGKSPLRGAPRLDAPAKGQVAFGQKLALEGRTTTDPKWIKVKVPGDPAEGWLPAIAAAEKRPSSDAVAVASAGAKINATEGSTAMAIRGLDGRTASYAKDKKLPLEVFDQLSRLEGFGEQQFNDHHTTDPKGGWHYPDSTVPGRVTAAQTFAASEGLNPPRPAPTPAAAAAATPTSAPAK